MTCELDILNQLRKVIYEQINQYLPTENPEAGVMESITDKNVVIDFPDVDMMPKKTMFCLVPNYSSYETLSTESDYSNFDISVFILCKKDKQENLIMKVYNYFNSLYKLLRTNTDLDGVADFTEVTDADFYSCVEGNPSVQAVECTVSVKYCKDW